MTISDGSTAVTLRKHLRKIMPEIDDVRKKLRDLLGDMDALKAYADVGNADAREFVDAFRAAREKAKAAARDYIAALG